MKVEDIIFRGKVIRDGEWAYGDLTRFQDGTISIEVGIRYYGVDPNTVGQYTGMTDKNGTKIFEGDIIERSVKEEFVGRVKPEVYEVQWKSSIGSYYLRMVSPYEDKVCFCGLPWWTSDSCEVIGNIHDD